MSDRRREEPGDLPVRAAIERYLRRRLSTPDVEGQSTWADWGGEAP